MNEAAQAAVKRAAAVRCPSCRVNSVKVKYSLEDKELVEVGRCGECERLVIRVDSRPVYISEIAREIQSDALPPDLAALCRDACSVIHISPRVATALLLPQIEKICDHAGARGADVNEKIEYLKARGKLPDDIFAGTGPPDEEEEFEDSRRRAYDLLKIVDALGPGAASFWPY